MTRDEAEFLAGLIEAEFPDLAVNGRAVFVETDFALDKGAPVPDGWYVRIDTAEDGE